MLRKTAIELAKKTIPRANVTVRRKLKKTGLRQKAEHFRGSKYSKDLQVTDCSQIHLSLDQLVPRRCFLT